MNKRSTVLAILLVLGLAAPAFAQGVEIDGTNVKVTGADGDVVEVEDGDVDIDSDDGDVEVDGDDVEVSDDSNTVRAKKRGKKRRKRKAVQGKFGLKHPPKKLKQRKPMVCNGADDMGADKVHIKGKRGVVVRGACDIRVSNSLISVSKAGVATQGSGDVYLKDVTIRSKGRGVYIQGSGTVHLNNVKLEADQAIIIDGSGDVIIKDSRIRGRIIKRGTGEIKRMGGNKFIK